MLLDLGVRDLLGDEVAMRGTELGTASCERHPGPAAGAFARAQSARQYLGQIREKIFKNYAAKSMDEVCEMLVKGSLYIERNPEMVPLARVR